MGYDEVVVVVCVCGGGGVHLPYVAYSRNAACTVKATTCHSRPPFIKTSKHGEGKEALEPLLCTCHLCSCTFELWSEERRRKKQQKCKRIDMLPLIASAVVHVFSICHPCCRHPSVCLSAFAWLHITKNLCGGWWGGRGEVKLRASDWHVFSPGSSYILTSALAALASDAPTEWQEM